MKKVVYMITTGEYYERRTMAVCSTQKLAKEAALVYDGDISKIFLNNIPKHPKGYGYYHIQFQVIAGYIDVDYVQREGYVFRDKKTLDDKEDNGCYFEWAKDKDAAVRKATARLKKDLKIFK